jgi:uncharacterized protein YjhX (UPF0386 family)
VKSKSRGRIQVVQDDNDEVTAIDNVLQLDELVNPYQVAPSIDLEKNSNFHVTKKTFVDVDAKKLKDILITSGHIEVDKDKDGEIDEVQFMKKMTIDMMMMMKLKKMKRILIKRISNWFISKTSMCNEIDINIMFPYIVALQ